MSIVELTDVTLKYEKPLTLEESFENLVSALDGVLTIYSVGGNGGIIGKFHAPADMEDVKEFHFLSEKKDATDFSLHFEGASELMLPNGKFETVYRPFYLSMQFDPAKGGGKGKYSINVMVFSKHFIPAWKDGTDNYEAAKHNVGLLAKLFEGIKSEFGPWAKEFVEGEAGFCKEGGLTVEELLDVDKLREFELERIEKGKAGEPVDGMPHNEYWHRRIERMYEEQVASDDLFYEENNVKEGQFYVVLRKDRTYSPELKEWLKKRQPKVITP